LVKNEVTAKKHLKIIHAIDNYAKETKDVETACYLLGDMESYYETLFRLWDWGCGNILSKPGYELIKPYIRKKQNAN
jgi:hypothetical protein